MIKRIKIRDFKSIREVELELGSVTVLVGRSGTGKSNLVQAIRFLRNLLLDQNEAVNFEFGWGRIVPVGNPGRKQPSRCCSPFPARSANTATGLGLACLASISGPTLRL